MVSEHEAKMFRVLMSYVTAFPKSEILRYSYIWHSQIPLTSGKCRGVKLCQAWPGVILGAEPPFDRRSWTHELVHQTCQRLGGGFHIRRPHLNAQGMGEVVMQCKQTGWLLRLYFLAAVQNDGHFYLMDHHGVLANKDHLKPKSACLHRFSLVKIRLRWEKNKLVRISDADLQTQDAPPQ